MLPDQPRLMIVDDDPVTCEMLCEVFAAEGFASRFVQSGDAAVSLLADEPLDVLVSDIRMKTPFDGLALLDHVRQQYPHLPVVLMTAFGSVDTAVRAVKQGAFDYVSKPFNIDALVATVRRALLITGESGTGKELVARAIHVHGERHLAPFVAVNCGALTETLLESELFGHVRGSFTGAVANKPGIFEQAQAGTVFLDEVSEMSTGLQVKLLRVLQERELVPVGGSSPITVNARVIAASGRDSETLMSSETFRHDLLYRLNVINIQLPPVRERREDISLLAGHFLRKHTPRNQTPPQLDETALSYLNHYAWPGNVRELENALERAVTLNQSGPITAVDLPRKIFEPKTQAAPLTQSDEFAPLFAGLPPIEEIQRRYLLHVLAATDGNRKRAAEILGINRKTLYRMAARFGIDLKGGSEKFPPG